MLNRKPSRKLFSRLEKVTNIGAGEIAAGRAVTFGVERARVGLVTLVCSVHDAAPCKDGRVTGIAAWHNAVKHIDAAVYSLDNVGGSSHAHKIARLVHGRERQHRIKNMIHHVRRLSDGKPASYVPP